MKREYDFSKGERGKFYHPDVEMHIPVYLDADVDAFMRKLSREKNREVEKIVNEWLRRDIDLIQSVR
jgi:hypothetical protein